MERRAFLFALTFAYGCGPNETPTKADRSTTATATEVANGKQQSTQPRQTKIPRVAVLIFGTRDTNATASSPAAALLRNRLTELGYLDGKTILIEERYADGDAHRLAQHAREIVGSNPDVIVAMAASATAAARQATSTIPIVMVHAGNPVGAGFVASLSHPGGNVTGTTSMVPDLGVKQVELLRELLPRLARLACFAIRRTRAPLRYWPTSTRRHAASRSASWWPR